MVEDDGCMFGRALEINSCDDCVIVPDCIDDGCRRQQVRHLMVDRNLSEKEACLNLMDYGGVQVEKDGKLLTVYQYLERDGIK